MNISFGEVTLEAGDAVFIPSMHFHSVHVVDDAWSVSANRYYFQGEDGGSEWLEMMQKKKKEEFSYYEEVVGERVC